MPLVVPYMESLQYDGTNGNYICGTWADMAKLSEDENGLLIGGVDNDNTYITPGMWVLKHRAYPSWVIACTNEAYLDQYRELS